MEVEGVVSVRRAPPPKLQAGAPSVNGPAPRHRDFAGKIGGRQRVGGRPCDNLMTQLLLEGAILEVHN
jgi:hypothetical protein